MMKLGTCGWGYFKANDFLADYREIDPEEKDWKEIYDHKVGAFADFFDLVEVNKTFYNLPQVKTARKWKKLARKVNEDFEFTVKAPKTITHEERFAGPEPREKFEKVKNIADALESKIILLQTPPSFGPGEENIEDMNRFFSDVNRGDFKLAWEPRGDWEEEKQKTKKICRSHNLIHCTDPFRALPAKESEVSYFRLHGKPPGDEMYKYNYKEADLRRLKERMEDVEAGEIYVLWNNYSMYRDLKKFEEIISQS